MHRPSTTAKGRITTDGTCRRFGNVTVSHITKNERMFVSVRIGTTDVTITLTPDNARLLANNLTTRAEHIDAERNNQ